MDPDVREIHKQHWSGGRVQDSILSSIFKSSPGFNTLPMLLMFMPMSKALHTALFFSTEEQMGTCKGRFVSRGAQFERLYTPQGFEVDIQMDIWTTKTQ